MRRIRLPRPLQPQQVGPAVHAWTRRAGIGSTPHVDGRRLSVAGVSRRREEM